MDALVQEMPLSISSYKDKADFLAAQNDYASLVDASKQRLALQTCSLRDNQTCALLPIRELRTWPTQTYHPLKVPRFKEGYLHKKGGKKSERPWQKRWVTFDGDELKYFKNKGDKDILNEVVKLQKFTSC